MKTSDTVLCAIVIRGSGQDSGEIDYAIDVQAMRKSCKDRERAREILHVLRQLHNAVEIEYQ